MPENRPQTSTGRNTWDIAQSFAPDYWLDREQTFVASVNEPLDNEETLNIHLGNPDGSGVKCYLYYAEMTHADELELTLHTGIEDESGVSALLSSNNVIGSVVESDADASEVDSFTSTDTHSAQAYVGSGTEPIFDGYRVLILEGHDLIVEVESRTGGNEVGIRLGWAEVPNEIGQGLI